MFENVLAGLIAGVILLLSSWLVGKVQPVAGRLLAARWGRRGPEIAADYAAAKSAPPWRKALASLMLVWGAGGVLAYVLTGSMDHTSPLWATWWLGSVSAFIWLYAGWLAVRWTVRQTRRL